MYLKLFNLPYFLRMVNFVTFIERKLISGTSTLNLKCISRTNQSWTYLRYTVLGDDPSMEIRKYVLIFCRRESVKPNFGKKCLLWVSWPCLRVILKQNGLYLQVVKSAHKHKKLFGPFWVLIGQKHFYFIRFSLAQELWALSLKLNKDNQLDKPTLETFKPIKKMFVFVLFWVPVS